MKSNSQRLATKRERLKEAVTKFSCVCKEAEEETEDAATAEKIAALNKQILEVYKSLRPLVPKEDGDDEKSVWRPTK